MANSVRENIMEAVVAALSGAGSPVTAAQVYRTPVSAIPEATTLAYAVNPIEEKEQFIAAGYTQRTLTIGVSCIARGAPPVDQLVDPLLQFTVTALVGSSSAVPGLVLEISELETLWEFGEGEVYTCNALRKFEIKFMTSRTDETVAGN